MAPCETGGNTGGNTGEKSGGAWRTVGGRGWPDGGAPTVSTETFPEDTVSHSYFLLSR